VRAENFVLSRSNYLYIVHRFLAGKESSIKSAGKLQVCDGCDELDYEKSVEQIAPGTRALLLKVDPMQPEVSLGTETDDGGERKVTGDSELPEAVVENEPTEADYWVEPVEIERDIVQVLVLPNCICLFLKFW
jgi:hypothetical protein